MSAITAIQALERADILRQEADIVMAKISLFEILQPYARVFPSGSYWLDVMAYPDIDLYITKIRIDQLFSIGAQLAGSELITQVVFEKTDDPLHLPDGLYLKPRVNYGDWGRPWKIDIWSLDERIIEAKMVDMQHFKDRMTPTLRELIIQYKCSVMTSAKRTPMYSGVYIYKAFIDEGITDFEGVSQYLIKSGIQLESH